MFAEKGFGKEFDILTHWLERGKLNRRGHNGLRIPIKEYFSHSCSR